ncbi:hypothetical protein O0L34_g2682 [Tuta absoluta]|nr:hypothetical protein O0L34_g2682 [Tuta absoluta]
MSGTNVSNLPSETLMNIFHYLNCNDLKNCGQVCNSWNAAAHEVSEFKWKQLCRKEFEQVYEDSFRKSRITWEDLYKSLRSWSQVSSSKVYFKYSELLEDRYVIPENKDRKLMQFLKNGIIGYPYYNVGYEEMFHFIGETYSFSTICYYDAETLREIGRVEYDFNFDQYQENDDFIVLRDDDMQLIIITKSNKKMHCIGEMKHDGDLLERTRFHLAGDSVFHFNMDTSLVMSKLVNDIGGPTIESTIIAPPELVAQLDTKFGFQENTLQAVAVISDKKINLLTQKGCIFSIKDKEVKLLCHVEKKEQNVVIDLLEQHGFHWNDPEIYSWITEDLNVAITHLKGATVQSYGSTVLVGTAQRVLHIYYNPYRKGQLKLNKAKPALRIDLNGWVPTGGAWPRHVCDSQRKINEIGVTEIKDGHRIILLYCQRLVAIEIRLDALKRSHSSGLQVGTVVAVGEREGDYIRII